MKAISDVLQNLLLLIFGGTLLYVGTTEKDMNTIALGVICIKLTDVKSDD